MSHLPWTRSREALLWRRLTPGRAGVVARAVFGEGARAEVLLRAYLAERDRDGTGVRFWLAVHAGMDGAGLDGVLGERAAPAPPGIAEAVARALGVIRRAPWIGAPQDGAPAALPEPRRDRH